jgi:hypothetical protein
MSHTMFGKWSQPGDPHKGWECIGTDDTGSPPSHLCEMCESMLCRFVHSMWHSNYPDVLECGCICSGNMSGDLDAARQCESQLKKAAEAARRRQLPSRFVPKRARAELPPGWSFVLPGVARTIVGDFEIDLFHDGYLWVSHVRRRGETRALLQCRHQTIEQAFQGALDRAVR